MIHAAHSIIYADDAEAARANYSGRARASVCRLRPRLSEERLRSADAAHLDIICADRANLDILLNEMRLSESPSYVRHVKVKA